MLLFDVLGAPVFRLESFAAVFTVAKERVVGFCDGKKLVLWNSWLASVSIGLGVEAYQVSSLSLYVLLLLLLLYVRPWSWCQYLGRSRFGCLVFFPVVA